MKRYLFCVAEGIGNIAQTFPLLETIRVNLNCKLDMWITYGAYRMPNVIKSVDNWFFKKDILEANLDEYDGRICNYFALRFIDRFKYVKDVYDTVPLFCGNDIEKEGPPLSTKINEVNRNMLIAKYLGINENNYVWDVPVIYDDTMDKFDVVIHDGYKKADKNFSWSFKSYPNYSIVADKLINNGYSVCSIGSADEHVKNTTDKTGLPFIKSLGLIKKSGVYIGNDSGMYHFSNILGVNNIVLFGPTSTDKNYNKTFHRYSTIMTNKTKCQPCTNSIAMKCENRKCLDVDPNDIYCKTVSLLNNKGEKQ